MTMWLADQGGLNRVVLCAIALMLVLDAGCQSNQAVSEENLNLRKQLAGELRDNKLYAAAIEEYEKILALEGITNTERANISYLVGRVYYEDLKDYRNAAAYYMRARALDPEGSFMPEASKNLVASLQKIGNLVDAKRELGTATDIDAIPQSDDDLPVARIGGKPVYRSQIEKAISDLPAEVQKQLLTPSAKTDFVRQYVGRELLYRAAVREQYPSDPEIVKQSEQLTKRLVIDKFVLDKVMPAVNVDSLDVRNYYSANKSTRYEDKPYDSVKARVFLDYQQEKAQAAYMNYINQLAKTENVEFLDQNWR